MAISTLELRHIIESAFLPMRSTCSASAHGELTIEIIDPATGLNVVFGGIPMASLGTSRAISDLIAQLRAQVCRPARHANAYRPRAMG
ncbi:DUF1652 domain-containing protein [Pseudomonas sp. NPDC088368]|jgi:hypothetical protein|uniref:DUF1652 domain-containing protein n=1 Tax=Pseudomonas sp. NPDC088368 TaxID=3364453 RepID=UPI003814371E